MVSGLKTDKILKLTKLLHEGGLGVVYQFVAKW